MLVAASTQTTSIISLKRTTSTKGLEMRRQAEYPI